MDIKHLILFDGVCNLCNSSVQFIIKNDPNAIFHFASLQSEIGQNILKQHQLPTDDFDSFIYIENDIVFQKSTAALKVLKTLGGKWKLAYFFIIFPAFIRDGIYQLIAKNRYKIWGKQESCWLPNASLNNRFLK